jgi:hypothetical protein
MMLLATVWNVRTQVERRRRLSNARNIVLPPLHGHQAGLTNGRQVNSFGAVPHFAFGEQIPHEDLINGLYVVAAIQIHDRHVLVVKFAMLGGRLAVALDIVIEQLAMRINVSAKVHGEEARKLQKPWINITSCARVSDRHFVDAMLPEPLRATLPREPGDGGFVFPRIDRAADQSC